MSARLVVGTRGSALALAQVELLRAALGGTVELEVRKITTMGDQPVDPVAAKAVPAGVKGMFTREIEQALIDGAIDVAVHSLKDVPGITPAELAIVAVLERASTADVLIAKSAPSLAALPAGARVGTASVRRARQLRWLRPDLEIVEHRGNVPTRLRKLAESSDLDAIVLAEAGLARLGIGVTEHGLLQSSLGNMLLPAIGQGAIALQIRADDTRAAALLAPANHEPTWLCIRAERELLRLLGGDCQMPVGALATLENDSLHLRAILFGKDGEPPREADAHSAEPEKLAQTVHSAVTCAGDLSQPPPPVAFVNPSPPPAAPSSARR